MDVASKSPPDSDCHEFELDTEEIHTPASSNFNALPGVAYYSCKVRAISSIPRAAEGGRVCSSATPRYLC